METDREILREVGIFLVLFYVFLNMLILLNIVIAMMADTYVMMTSVRKGIYNYNIIKVAPTYKLDKYYGGLSMLTPPFCLIGTFCLLPYYLSVHDKKRLERFN